MIRISKQVIDGIQTIASNDSETETGGILIGKGSFKDGDVFITHFTGPGPRSIKKRYYFSRDTEYCQKALDDIVLQTKGECDYLGEWHKHFEKKPRPSMQDVSTMMQINENDCYHINDCVMLIIGSTGEILAYYLLGTSATSITLQVVDDSTE
jgi:integrative and conjugative element protein (TIGR02256 family)